MGARDDDIDLMRARFHRAANFRDALGERRESGGKSGGDRRNVNAASFQCMQRGFDESVINANRAHLDAEFLDAEFLHEILLDGLSRLRAQSPHALIGVVAGERCQIHAGDRAQKPCGLPFFLHRSARHLRLGAAFHGARVHANFLHPVQIERNAGVREQRTPGERGDRIRRVRLAGSPPSDLRARLG